MMIASPNITNAKIANAIANVDVVVIVISLFLKGLGGLLEGWPTLHRRPSLFFWRNTSPSGELRFARLD